MTDVLLRHTDDGGEIDIVNGRVTLDEGLETAAYLSLFGGNVRDNGLGEDNRLQWWGNFNEIDRARHMRSETQHLIATIPAIPANLRRVEDAVRRDLTWITADVAQDLEVEVTMPGVRQIKIDVEIIGVDGQTYPLSFARAWGQT